MRLIDADALKKRLVKCAREGVNLNSGIARIIESFPSAQPTQTNADSTQINTLDCVSRQAAIDAVSEGCQELRGIFWECKEKLLALPSAQVERKHGRWLTETIHYKDEEQEFYYIETRCSCCGVEAKQGWWAFAFCPNCGVEMRGEDE